MTEKLQIILNPRLSIIKRVGKQATQWGLRPFFTHGSIMQKWDTFSDKAP